MNPVSFLQGSLAGNELFSYSVTAMPEEKEKKERSRRSPRREEAKGRSMTSKNEKKERKGLVRGFRKLPSPAFGADDLCVEAGEESAPAAGKLKVFRVQTSFLFLFGS